MQHDIMLELAVLRKLCINVSSSLALQVIDAIDRKDYLYLVNLDIKPDDYESAYSFGQDYMIAKFLSKWQGFSLLLPGLEPRQAAVDTWISVEMQNAETNNRLKYSTNSTIDIILHDASIIVKQILGPLNKSNVLNHCRWTNGATVTAKYGTPLDKKISVHLDVTKSALPYAALLLNTDPHWFESISGIFPSGLYSVTKNNFKVVDYNRFVTVPKNAKTERSICAEPTLNQFLQQGVREYMTNRLRVHGIRIDDQSINQRLAARAVNEDLATVDLRNASDSLTTGLVYRILPNDWAIFLDELRSEKTKIKGDVIKLNKFCSMGNAFTFPLETLIFHAITKACTRHLHGGRNVPVSAYGDDIICHRSVYPLLKETLSHVGFEVNSSKSFVTGRFFESCGMHYFDGYDVTPIYQKTIVGAQLHELIRLTNRIVRWSIRLCDDWNSPPVRGLFRFLTKGIKNGPYIPVGPSDDGFIVPTSWLRSYDINHGYCCRVYIFKQTLRRARHEIALIAYKYRNPSYSNAAPNGACLNSSGTGIWKFSKRNFGVHDIQFTGY